jgi:4-hydroxybenzoate polyprenyltransferase
MTMLRGLVRGCHPLPSVAVTLVAALLAVGVGLGPAGVVLFTAAVFTGQLSIGWSNDRIDAARDVVAERRDKPTVRGLVEPEVLSVAAVGALVVTVGLSLVLGWLPGLVALALVAAGWAYNLGLKRTVFSGLAYLVGFAALPAAAYLAVSRNPAWYAVITGALLGLGAHFANVLPDVADDIQSGVRGLPHRLGRRAGLVVLAGALGTASLVIVLGPGKAPAIIGWVGAVVAVMVAAVGLWRPAGRAAFRGALVVALLDVVLFLLSV